MPVLTANGGQTPASTPALLIARSEATAPPLHRCCHGIAASGMAPPKAVTSPARATYDSSNSL